MPQPGVRGALRDLLRCIWVRWQDAFPTVGNVGMLASRLVCLLAAVVDCFNLQVAPLAWVFTNQSAHLPARLRASLAASLPVY